MSEVPSFAADGAGRWLLKPAFTYDGDAIRPELAIEIDAGRIVAVHPAAEAPAGLPIWRSTDLAAPGFFDVQVNGGGGVLFNAEPTADAMRAIAAAHRRCGTANCLITLITDTDDIFERAVDAAIAASGRDGVIGIHIEGPHLSPKRRGTHRADLLRPWQESTFTRVERLRRAGVPVLLTLAPEVVPEGVIARLTALGAVVSLGHSAAPQEIALRAIAEGARAATHLFNGMDPPTSRVPGLVGTVVLSELYAGFVADGHHVHPDMLKIVARARPRPGRMMLISDAMPTVNGPSSFTLQGQMITVRDGKLVNAEGSLAGVHATMASSLVFLRRSEVMSVADALDAAVAAPSRLMGLADRLGRIAANYPADLNLLDPNTLTLHAVIVAGRAAAPALI
ncbi:MAG: N-acetylglucosamine-6-phosphate deacetylase [Ancalomicrobiaceae bacterium]|nr:N-acetylglucosamine-6-phosphate deacetylase [Ancalomicrobiaceae bacterium]